MEAVDRITAFPYYIFCGAATASLRASLRFKLTTRFVQALLLLFGGAFASTAPAQEPIYFAGVAFLGDYQYIDKNYPLARELEQSGARLNEVLVTALKQSTAQHLEIRYELGDLDRTTANVLAIALDRERVSRERFVFSQGVRTKIVVEASFQLLVYNLASGTLIDSEPVSLAINHVVADDGQDAKEIGPLELARILYLGSGDDSGLVQLAAEAVNAYQPVAATPLRYRLVTLDWHERVLDVLEDGRDADHILQVFGQWFSGQLAEHTNVSVVPFNRGYAFGNQLPGRFINGEAFNLKLPEPDIAFHVSIDRLSKQTDQGNVYYRVQAAFKMDEPFTGRTLIDGDFRTGVPKTATEARILSDDWSAYEDAVEDHFDELIMQLKSPDRRWHKMHARAENSYSQFSSQQDRFND